jgi:hypothetical protein
MPKGKPISLGPGGRLTFGSSGDPCHRSRPTPFTENIKVDLHRGVLRLILKAFKLLSIPSMATSEAL